MNNDRAVPKRSRKYTDEDIIRISSQVTSMAQLLSALRLKPAGGNYHNMRKHLQRLNIDAAHWTGQAWGRETRAKDWAQYVSSDGLRKRMLYAKKHACEHCKLDNWLEEPIPLEVHHVDGDVTNNSFDNLQLLCPNCHALTDTWRGRKLRSEDPPKKRVAPKKPCPTCGTPIHISSKNCIKCGRTTKITWPDTYDLIKMLKAEPCTHVARRLGVSDTAIRNRLKSRGINPSSLTPY